MKYVIGLLRFLFRFVFGLGIWTIFCSTIGLLLKLFGFDHSVIFKVYRVWRSAMLIFLNVKIKYEGSFPKEPGIIFANHRSYLDVLLIPVKIPITFVAKANVKGWPVVGWGGKAMHTVWVDRNSPKSRKETREQLQERLISNKSVVVFPEGKTTKGPKILEFKPGMFHSVAKNGFNMYTIAIEYKDPNIAFVDNDLFVPHLYREFSKPKFEVIVKISDVISGDDGDKLRVESFETIQKQVIESRKYFDQIQKED